MIVESLPIILGNYVEVRDGKSQEFDIESFNHGSATRKVLAIFNELGLGEDLQRARVEERFVQEKQPCVEEFTRLLNQFCW